MTFTCSICGEESTRICARCTKDACPNHICDRCGRCSDCCECEIAIAEPVRAFTPASQTVHPSRQEPEATPGEPGEAQDSGPSGPEHP